MPTFGGRFLYLGINLRSFGTPSRLSMSMEHAALLPSFNLDAFTDVCLVCMNPLEEPDAAKHDIVLRTVSILKHLRKGVGWGRWLWRDQPDSRLTNAHLETDWYASMISTVRGEASGLQVDFTLLDMEPYDASPQLPFAHPNEIDAGTRTSMETAIDTATNRYGKIDIVTPTSSPLAGSFLWPLTRLGDFRAGQESYYAIDPTYTPFASTPPAGYTHQLHYWGSYVAKPKTLVGSNYALTPTQLRALKFSSIRNVRPEAQGMWAFIEFADLTSVLRLF